ncbi:Inner tegument protein, partial [Dissostichus eleginoides]
ASGSAPSTQSANQKVRMHQVLDSTTPRPASLLGLKSARHTRTILNEWIQRLTDDEMEMLREYSNRERNP